MMTTSREDSLKQHADGPVLCWGQAESGCRKWNGAGCECSPSSPPPPQCPECSPVPPVASRSGRVGPGGQVLLRGGPGGQVLLRGSRGSGFVEGVPGVRVCGGLCAAREHCCPRAPGWGGHGAAPESPSASRAAFATRAPHHQRLTALPVGFIVGPALMAVANCCCADHSNL